MPKRPRVTRPQNMGANRNVAMRNNTRAGRPMPFQQGAFQGGLRQGPVGSQAQPQAQQNNMQCPVGQRPGRGLDGRPTCVPDNQAVAGQGPRGIANKGSGGASASPRVRPDRY